MIGTIDKVKCPGFVSFEANGSRYKLEAIAEGEHLFFVFGDATNGIETYGAGRFLYCDIPADGNTVILDFNKAYNPPCAFTNFATCPIPPQENILTLKINAGEKSYGNQ